MDNIHKLHGLPQVIVSDQDRMDFFTSLNVELKLTTTHRLETDGQPEPERVNQCLESYLGSMTFHEPKCWCNLLPAAEWWHNTSYHISLKTSPLKALYGYQPPQIAEMAIPCTVSDKARAALIDTGATMTKLQENRDHA